MADGGYMALRAKAEPPPARWPHPEGTAINTEILELEDMVTEATVVKYTAMEEMAADIATPKGLLASPARLYSHILESRHMQ